MVCYPSPPARLLSAATCRTGFGLVKNPQPCVGGVSGTLSPHCFPSLSAPHPPCCFSARPRAGNARPPPAPQGPRALPPSHHGVLNRAESMALGGGWLWDGGGHRERRVTRAAPCFPSGHPGANECTEPQPGQGGGSGGQPVCFHFALFVFCLDQLLSSGLGL